MAWAAGLARKNTTSATSSAEVRRPAGVRARAASSSASPSGKARHTSVATAPADTALTVIPRGASSTAR